MRPEGAAAPLIVGHSAGGCLALAWATHHGADLPQARVRALAPITDLIREARGGLAEGAVLDYMGALPDEAPEAYRWEDPRSRAALLPDGFDARIIHGTDDATVDIGFSRDMPLPAHRTRRRLPLRRHRPGVAVLRRRAGLAGGLRRGPPSRHPTRW
ncbi:alpha/beta hydrolase family protein [Nesterenkonia sp. PF2B19]|uniref:alpha/beta hydrolase family protein n=1 Tax=Nesterenkonia sp. PF2B19 TaxID=1881858 RepID=UPI000A19C941|nr:hypothetical protein [Nesterenkonia sp. PF2B19]OSM44291.1 hypothetical protein BCY76_002850 [Nesterenkonia sp. PF2B19]